MSKGKREWHCKDGHLTGTKCPETGCYAPRFPQSYRQSPMEELQIDIEEGAIFPGYLGIFGEERQYEWFYIGTHSHNFNTLYIAKG